MTFGVKGPSSFWTLCLTGGRGGGSAESEWLEIFLGESDFFFFCSEHEANAENLQPRGCLVTAGNVCSS